MHAVVLMIIHLLMMDTLVAVIYTAFLYTDQMIITLVTV